MIELLTFQTIPSTLLLCKEFFEQEGYMSDTFNEEKVLSVLKDVVEDPYKIGILAVADDRTVVGMLLATTTEVIFNNEIQTCELAWYLKPEYRNTKAGLELIKQYEYWSKHVIKADICGMVDLAQASLEDLYTRRGYQQVERAYWKRNN